MPYKEEVINAIRMTVHQPVEPFGQLAIDSLQSTFSREAQSREADPSIEPSIEAITR